MFKNETCISENSLPTPSEEGLANFLSSSYIKGIGKVYSRKIVENKGFNILDSDFDFDEELKDIPGLGKNKIEELKNSFSSLKYSPRLMAFLYSSNLRDEEVEKILSHYKKATEKVILEDPYQMVEEVFKLSFFTADKIGRKLGITIDDPRRIQGALVTSVKISAEHGNMFATEEEAVSTASRITGTDKEKIYHEIEPLIKNERLIRSHNGLYLPVYYKAEKEGAERLARIILNHKDDDSDFPLPSVDREGNPLSEGQLDAIKTVVSNPVTIITGGPGTGKTTSIRGLIKLLEDQDKRVVLAAPTGRAAKRLADLSGREAKTLHRLLGYNKGRGYRNKAIDADVLIIDEASMLEQVMFNHLLEALKPETKIVLVGDIDQLPAIGAGDVLRDMIKSGRIPVVTLTENFRNKEGSLIAENATAINHGQTPEYIDNEEFIIINEISPSKIHKRLLQLVAEEIPRKYHISPKNIQIVSPQQEGPLGAKQLNIDIQKCVNPEGPELRSGERIFRLGDRVMQKSNSSARNTYNGETGWISNIDTEAQNMEVTFFDGKKSIYGRKDLKELSLAYATTVHKLQGSETDYMVMPMTMSHKNMLYRNLLYTGISRAKKLCVLVGEDKAIKTAIDNPAPSIRNSNFNHRLKENIPSPK
ncbi:MAG: AAA family ATPase [Muribaculaceae bacterium]|nr:AAA family ATPase [Muribaculaceae bacterium]